MNALNESNSFPGGDDAVPNSIFLNVKFMTCTVLYLKSTEIKQLAQLLKKVKTKKEKK